MAVPVALPFLLNSMESISRTSHYDDDEEEEEEEERGHGGSDTEDDARGDEGREEDEFDDGEEEELDDDSNGENDQDEEEEREGEELSPRTQPHLTRSTSPFTRLMPRTDSPVSFHHTQESSSVEKQLGILSTANSGLATKGENAMDGSKKTHYHHIHEKKFTGVGKLKWHPNLQQHRTHSQNKRRAHQKPPRHTCPACANRDPITWATVRKAWLHRHDVSHPSFAKALFQRIWGKDCRFSEEQVEVEYRWLPILSGLVVPFSILLEIPGLTEHWYAEKASYADPSTATVYRPNPVILEVGLGISIFSAVVANVCLILRFLERKVKGSTKVAINFLVIHDLINIVSLIVFGVKTWQNNDGFIFSEAYWMTVCSTCVSLFTTATLLIDWYKTPNFGKSGSGLTPKQRNLVIIVMILLAYIALGSLVFTLIIPNLSFQDGLYYTICTIETIGFGDIVPISVGARIFFFFFESFGIINLAVAVGTAQATLVESWEAAYRKRRYTLQAKHRERKLQRQEEREKKAAIERQLLALGLPAYVQSHRGARHGTKMQLNVRALTKDDMQSVQNELDRKRVLREEESGSASAALTPNAEHQVLQNALQLEKMLTAQSLSHEETYREFQEKLKEEEKREGLVKIAGATTLFFAFWMVGAAVFSRTESWSFWEGMYFCYVAFSTVGYGDYLPKTPGGRAFFIVWAIMGVAAMTILLSVLAEFYKVHYQQMLRNKGAQKAVKAYRTQSIASASQWSATPSTDTSEEKPRLRKLSMHHTSLPDPDELPLKIIESAKTFHSHLRYFMAPKSGPQMAAPDSLTQFVDEVTAGQSMSALQKDEMLNDEEARRDLMLLSYEKSLKELMALAEESIKVNASRSLERDALMALASPTSITSQRTRPRRGFSVTTDSLLYPLSPYGSTAPVTPSSAAMSTGLTSTTSASFSFARHSAADRWAEQGLFNKSGGVALHGFSSEPDLVSTIENPLSRQRSYDVEASRVVPKRWQNDV